MVETFFDDIRKEAAKALAWHVDKGYLQFLKDYGMDKDKMLAYLAQGTPDAGRALENLTQQVFEAKGYEVVKKNWIVKLRGLRREIDLVARKGKETVLIECKHRKGALGSKDFDSYVMLLEHVRAMKDADVKPNKLLIVSLSGVTTPVLKYIKELNKEKKPYTAEVWDRERFWQEYQPLKGQIEATAEEMGKRLKEVGLWE